MYIYLIRNIINDKIYIGQTTKTPEKRFRQHVYTSKRLKTQLYNSMNKYGEENFIVEVLEVVQDKSLLDPREIYWIAELEPEYNMTIGGQRSSTTEKYTEERKRERSAKSSASIKKMWDSMSEDERKERMKKTHAKTDYKSHSDKLSVSRRRFFTNETEEQKAIRIEKAKIGAKKTEKIKCHYCDQEIGGGKYNLVKHEEVCSKNPSSKNFGKSTKKKQPYSYTILDPNNTKHITSSFKGFCKTHNLSRYLLMKNIGSVVESVDAKTNNANATTINTFGWCLLRIDDLT
jgi:group I intron endonuclease